MSKKDLSEADICDRYITPALYEAGWKKSQIRREYGFTDGQMIVRGQMAARGARKRADYLLYYPSNQPSAVIEANLGRLLYKRRIEPESLVIALARRVTDEARTRLLRIIFTNCY